MRKLLPVALLLCGLSAQAAEWARVGNDNRIDLSAVKLKSGSVTYQVRWDNPSDANDYMFTEIVANCKSGDTYFSRIYEHHPGKKAAFRKPTGENAKHGNPPKDSPIGFLNNLFCSGQASVKTIEEVLYQAPAESTAPSPEKPASAP